VTTVTDDVEIYGRAGNACYVKLLGGGNINEQSCYANN